MGFRIYDFMPTGLDNTIPSKQLTQIMGFRSVRELQRTVEAERVAGAVILCNPSGAGYYRSDNPEELRQFIQTLNARASNTTKAVASTQNVLDVATGQDRAKGWWS